MRHPARLLCATLCTAAIGAPARGGDDQDKFEEQATIRCAHARADRSVQVEQWERAATIRDLEAVYPGKLPKTEPGKNPNEAEDWFALVSGGADEWRKADAKAAGLGPMYERWAQRLELGPVPSIKKDEFVRFAKMIINNTVMAVNQGAGAVNLDAEADKVFRILDLNSDDELVTAEMSSGLRDDKAQADANNDGRISKEEYRDYFKRRVEKKAEALTAAFKANAALMANLNLDRPDKRTGLPGWFATLDADKDGQVSLFEWREGKRLVAEFYEMDLNGDGLLTKDEYARWVKLRALAVEEKRREEGK